MLFTKGACQFVSGLANYLYVLHRCIEEHRVVIQLLDGLIFSELENVVDGHQNMFQPLSVSNWLSHILTFYLG